MGKTYQSLAYKSKQLFQWTVLVILMMVFASRKGAKTQRGVWILQRSIPCGLVMEFGLEGYAPMQQLPPHLKSPLSVFA
ncbi:MAG: hypothetical protein AMXMBFR84_20890 [Candidatus Hydrogenedentota bacterium]